MDYNDTEIEDYGLPAFLDFLNDNSTNPCEASVVPKGFSEMVMGILAFAMFIILTFSEKRKKKCSGCCNKRGGLLLPVNFLEDKTNRGMIVAAFMFTGIGVLETYNQLEVTTGSLPAFLSVLAKVYFVILVVLSYSPLFHCISVISLLNNLLGLIYIVTSTVVMVMESTSVCAWTELSHDFLSTQIVDYIIYISCGGFLTYQFLFRILRTFIEYRKDAPPAYVYPFQIQYIKNLLNPPAKAKSACINLTLKDKLWMIIQKLSYKSIPGFRFSISILVSIAVGLLIFTVIVTEVVGVAVGLYVLLRGMIQENQDRLSSPIPNIFIVVARFFSRKKAKEAMKWQETTITIFQFCLDQLNCFFVSMIMGVLFSAFQITCTVLLMLKSYRKNILHLYRKEYNEELMNSKKFGNVALMVSAVQFTGYQIAHMVWGYSLQALVIFLLSLVIGELIVLPAKYGYWGVLLTLINKFGPILFVILMTMLIQRILVMKVFLLERGKVFGVDNRKGFYNFMFFMVYYNFFTGMLTCIIRILKALLLGVWFFPRLDMSIFPRVGEPYDTGYKAYVCLLALEQMQNNIILNTFFQLLIESSQATSFPSNGHVPVLSTDTVFLPTTRSFVGKRARNRWFLVWTLIHNPSLTKHRRWPNVTIKKTLY